MINSDYAYGFLYGCALILFLDFALNMLRKEQKKQRMFDANKVLALHGIRTTLYLPTVGVSDEKLYAALDEFSFSGRIALSKDGEIIGKLLPTVEKGPHLRLVIDNT
jgi:mannose/fructose/N-acetylgalactosamine-specific phosphotransferase system component IID